MKLSGENGTLKNPNGRPLLYSNPEDLEKKIDEYFEVGVAHKELPFKKGKETEMISVPCPTITGLVLFCGFCDRQSFYDYENRERFSCTIKKARTRIEKHYEELLQMGGAAGPIFALKNMGWSDKQQIDMNANVVGNININLVPSQKPKDNES